MTEEARRSTPRRLTSMRFSIRGLIALVLVLGAGMGWLAKRINVQRDAAAAVKSAGALVLYDHYYDKLNHPNSSSRSLNWLVDRVGVDHFANVVHVEFNRRGSDEHLVQIGNLSRLEFLSLEGRPSPALGSATYTG
jgi:hypothetical protein